MNSGIYRQRSYDNLQNGKSPINRLNRLVHMPRTSCDHLDLNYAQQSSPIDQQSCSDQSVVIGQANNPVNETTPVPTNFKYFSPQQRRYNEHAAAQISRYPYHRNRAVPRRYSQSYDYRHQRRGDRDFSSNNNEMHIANPLNSFSLLGDLDFIDSTEDDPMINDHNKFRVTKRNTNNSYYANDRSPARKKQRYSNIYDYSLKHGLKSIHEDSTSDDSF